MRASVQWMKTVRAGLPKNYARNVLGAVAGFSSVAAFASCDSAGLDPKQFKSFKIDSVSELNHNTKLYKFVIPQQEKTPCTSYVLTEAPFKTAEGKPVIRPYTPVEQKDGEMTLLVKSYEKGNMSKHFGTLQAGDSVSMKGPMKKYPYVANSKKEIAMVAGGTGITPMLQVIKEVLDNPNDKTQLTLLFSNSTEKDIMLQAELDALAHKHANFTVHYVVSRPEGSWRGLTGRLNEDTLRRHLPVPSKDVLVCICGPLDMYKSLSGTKGKNFTQGEVGGVFATLGFSPDMVYKF